MALLGNYSLASKSPGRSFGGNSTAVAAGIGQFSPQAPSMWGNSGAMRNFALQDLATVALELTSRPEGYAGSGYMMPLQGGGISSHNATNGVAAFSGALAEGRALAGTFAGVAAFTATGQLVVSGSGAFAGTSSFSANVVAALAASGTFAGTSSFSGAVMATGHVVGAFTGSASFTATRYATGSLAGSFTDEGTLTVANVGAAVWSSLATENNVAGTMGELLNNSGAGANPWTTEVESGLTALDALKIIAAAVGGKVSGGGTTTITIRNAFADSKNRIIATVDTDGNRSAITYDLT